MFTEEDYLIIRPLLQAIQDELIQRSLTVATAESCTGGLLSALLTEIPGSSQVFMGGMCTYSNASKVSLLGIDQNLIESEGAVSQAIALAMAEQVRKKLNADIGVGITGIAGPEGASAAKPLGTVWLAISHEGKVTARNLALSGTRITIRKNSVKKSIEALSALLNGSQW